MNIKSTVRTFVCLTGLFLSCLLSSCSDHQQTAPSQEQPATAALVATISEEKASGYQGGFIEQLQVQEKALNFLVVGDWGRNGQYHQKTVAEQMGNAAMTMDAEFIISTGDNFYPDGVTSTGDPQWKSSFEEVYTAHSLFQDWNVVLGNHDYRSNPEAQIAYSKISRRWNMPDYYYAKKVAIDGDSTQKVLFVYIDTNPFVKKYYQDEKSKANVAKQDTLAQIKWLNQMLSDPDPSIKWKIVVVTTRFIAVVNAPKARTPMTSGALLNRSLKNTRLIRISVVMNMICNILNPKERHIILCRAQAVKSGQRAILMELNSRQQISVS